MNPNEDPTQSESQPRDWRQVIEDTKKSDVQESKKFKIQQSYNVPDYKGLTQKYSEATEKVTGIFGGYPNTWDDKDYQKFLVNNQPVLERFWRSNVKYSMKTGINAVGGFVGGIYGAGSALINQDYKKLYDNEVDNFLLEISKEWDEYLPIYKSPEYMDMTFGQKLVSTNTGERQMFVDEMTDAMAFTSGAILAGILTEGLSALRIPGMIGKVFRITNAFSKASKTGRQILKGIGVGEKVLETTSLYSKQVIGVSKNLGKFAAKLYTGASWEASVEAKSAAMTAKEQMYQKFRDVYKREPNESEINEIERKVNDVAAYTYIWNLAVLSITEMNSMPSVFGLKFNKLSSFWKTARTAGVEATEEGLRVAEKGAFKSIYQGTKNFLRPLWEGGEEMAQNVIRDASIDYFSIRYDPLEDTLSNDAISVISRNIQKSLASKQAWNEAGMGLILGIMGSPGMRAKIRSGYDAETGTQYSHTPLWTGGIAEIFQQPRREKMEAQYWEDLSKAMELAPEKVVANIMAQSRTLDLTKMLKENLMYNGVYSRGQNEALEKDDKFNHENFKHNKFFHMAVAYIKTGNKDRLIDILKFYQDDNTNSAYTNPEEVTPEKRRENIEKLISAVNDIDKHLKQAQIVVNKAPATIQEAFTWGLSTLKDTQQRKQELALQLSNDSNGVLSEGIIEELLGGKKKLSAEIKKKLNDIVDEVIKSNPILDGKDLNRTVLDIARLKQREIDAIEFLNELKTSKGQRLYMMDLDKNVQTKIKKEIIEGVKKVEENKKINDEIIELAEKEYVGRNMSKEEIAARAMMDFHDNSKTYLNQYKSDNKKRISDNIAMAPIVIKKIIDLALAGDKDAIIYLSKYNNDFGIKNVPVDLRDDFRKIMTNNGQKINETIEDKNKEAHSIAAYKRRMNMVPGKLFITKNGNVVEILGDDPDILVNVNVRFQSVNAQNESVSSSGVIRSIPIYDIVKPFDPTKTKDDISDLFEDPQNKDSDMSDDLKDEQFGDEKDNGERNLEIDENKARNKKEKGEIKYFPQNANVVMYKRVEGIKKNFFYYWKRFKEGIYNIFAINPSMDYDAIEASHFKKDKDRISVGTSVVFRLDQKFIEEVLSGKIPADHLSALENTQRELTGRYSEKYNQDEVKKWDQINPQNLTEEQLRTNEFIAPIQIIAQINGKEYCIGYMQIPHAIDYETFNREYAEQESILKELEAKLQIATGEDIVEIRRQIRLQQVYMRKMEEKLANAETARNQIVAQRKYVLEQLALGKEVSSQITEVGSGKLLTLYKEVGENKENPKFVPVTKTPDGDDLSAKEIFEREGEETVFGYVHNGTIIFPNKTEREIVELRRKFNLSTASGRHFSWDIIENMNGAVFVAVETPNGDYAAVRLYRNNISEDDAKTIVDILSTVTNEEKLQDVTRQVQHLVYLTNKVDEKGRALPGRLTIHQDNTGRWYIVRKAETKESRIYLDELNDTGKRAEAIKYISENFNYNIQVGLLNSSRQDEIMFPQNGRTKLVTNVLPIVNSDGSKTFFSQVYVEYEVLPVPGIEQMLKTTVQEVKETQVKEEKPEEQLPIQNVNTIRDTEEVKEETPSTFIPVTPPSDEDEVLKKMMEDEEDEDLGEIDLEDDKEKSIEPAEIARRYYGRKTLGINEFKKWLRKTLPGIKLEDVDIERLHEIMREPNANAIGLTKNAVIYLCQMSDNAVGYHEAMHIVIDHLLSPEERTELLSVVAKDMGIKVDEFNENVFDKYKKRGYFRNIEYSDGKLINKKTNTEISGEQKTKTIRAINNLLVEEEICNRFEEWKTNPQIRPDKGKKTLRQLLNNLFDRILRFFNLFKLHTDDLYKFFSQIDTGAVSGRSRAYMRSYKPSSELDEDMKMNLIPTLSPLAAHLRTYNVTQELMGLYFRNLQKGETIVLTDLFSEVLKRYERQLVRVNEKRNDQIFESKKDILEKRYMELLGIISNFEIIEKGIRKNLRSYGFKIDAVGKVEIDEAYQFDEHGFIIGIQDAQDSNTKDKFDDSPDDGMQGNTTKTFGERLNISSVRSASKRMRVLFMAIRQIAMDGKPAFDHLGMPLYTNFFDLYFYVEKILMGYHNYEEMIDRLKSMSKYKPELEELIKKLEETINTKERKNLQADFKKNFDKQNVSMIMVLADKVRRGDGYIYRVFDMNRHTIEQSMVDDWNSNLLDPGKNKITKYENGVVVRNTKVINELLVKWNELKDKKLNGFKDETKQNEFIDEVYKLLKSFGLEISHITIKYNWDDTADFIIDINNVLNNISKEEEDVEDYEATKKRLANYEIACNIYLTASHFVDVNNNSVYTTQLPSFISKMMDAIKIGSFGQFEREKKRDAKYKHSLLLAKLADQKFREKIFRQSFHGGLKRSGYRRKGKNFTSMSEADYQVSALMMYNNRGNKEAWIPYIIPADKTMQPIFRIDKFPVAIDPVTGMLVHSLKYSIEIPQYSWDYNLKNPDKTKRLAALRDGKIIVNGAATLDEFWINIQGLDRGEASEQKKIVFKLLEQRGWTLEKLKSIINNRTAMFLYLILHEQSRIDNKDIENYWREGKDLTTPDKIEMELRASLDALTKLENATVQIIPSIKNNQIISAFYKTFLFEIQRAIDAKKVVDDYLEEEDENVKKEKFKKLVNDFHYVIDKKTNQPVFKNTDGEYAGRAFYIYSLPGLISEHNNISELINSPGFKIEQIIDESQYNTKPEFNYEFVNTIRNKITYILNERVADYVNYLIDIKVISRDVQGRFSSNVINTNFLFPKGDARATMGEDQILKQIIVESYLTSYWFNIEASNLFNNDVAFYKDLIKRTYQSQSMMVSGKYNKGDENVNILHLSDPTYNFTPEKRKLYDKFLGSIGEERLVDTYQDSKTADATVWITLEEWRRIMQAEGKWSSEMDELYDYLEGKESRKPHNYPKGIVGPIKTFLFTHREITYNDTGVTISVPVAEKCTLVPLFERFVGDDEGMKDIKEAMKRTGAQHAAVTSALKYGVGASIGIDKLKNTNTDELKGYVSVVPRDNLGTQTENPPHFEDEYNKSMRQFKMLIAAGVRDDMQFSDGRTGAQVKQEIFDTESQILRMQLIGLQKKMSHNKDLARKVKTSLERLGYTERLEKLLKVDRNGNFINDISLFSKQFEELISSIYKDDALKVKFHGGSGISICRVKLKEELQIKYREDDSIEYYECELPAYYKKFFNNDGSLKKSVDNNSELLMAIGYRIPTEGYHSMLPLRCVKFHGDEFNGMVALPHEAVNQLGEDFDNDKIYFIVPEIVENEDGTISKVKYGKEEQSREALLNKLFDLYYGILTHKDITPYTLSPSNLIEVNEVFDYLDEEERKHGILQQNLSFFDPLFQAKQKAINHTGIKLKGIAALRVTAHAVMSYVSARLIPDAGNRIRAIRFNGRNITEVGKQYSEIDNKFIVKRISTLLAAILDDLKDPKIFKLGINDETLSTLITIIDAGFSIKTAVNFMTQPIIQEYIKNIIVQRREARPGGIKFIRIGDFVESSSMALESEIKAIKELQIQEMYYRIFTDIVDKISGKITDGFDVFDISDEEMERFRIMGKYEVGRMNFTDEENEQIKKGIYTDEMKKKLKNKLDYDIFQLKVIYNFSKYQALTNTIQEFSQILAINNEVGPSFETCIAKVKRFKKMMSRIQRNDENKEVLNKIYDEFNIIKDWNSEDLAIIGFERIYDKYISAIEAVRCAVANNETLGRFLLYNTRFFDMVKMQLQGTLETVMNRYDDDKLNTIDKDLEGFLNYIFLSEVMDITRDKIKSIFVGKNNLGKRIRDFMTKYKEEANNVLFKKEVISFIISNTENGLNLVKMKSNKYEPSLIDQMANIWQAYRSIPEEGITTKQKELKDILQDLIIYAVVSSNMWYAQNSYHKILPPEFFQDSGWNKTNKEVRTLIRNDEAVGGRWNKLVNLFVNQVVRNNHNLVPKIYFGKGSFEVESKITVDKDVTIYNVIKIKRSKFPQELSTLTGGPVFAFRTEFIQHDEIGADFTYIFDRIDEDVNGYVYYRYTPELGKNGFLKEFWIDDIYDSINEDNNHHSVVHPGKTRGVIKKNDEEDDSLEPPPDYNPDDEYEEGMGEAIPFEELLDEWRDENRKQIVEKETLLISQEIKQLEIPFAEEKDEQDVAIERLVNLSEDEVDDVDMDALANAAGLSMDDIKKSAKNITDNIPEDDKDDEEQEFCNSKK